MLVAQKVSFWNTKSVQKHKTFNSYYEKYATFKYEKRDVFKYKKCVFSNTKNMLSLSTNNGHFLNTIKCIAFKYEEC